MNEFESVIKDLNIPNQLKNYLLNSKSIQDKLSEELLKDVEDLYILFKSLYVFDESEFCSCVITTIRRCKDLGSFYFYLKKILDTNLKFESIDKKLDIGKEKNGTKLDWDIVDGIFIKTASSFIESINSIYHKELDIDMSQTYKNVGKLELINELIENAYFIKLLNDGEKVIAGHNKDK